VKYLLATIAGVVVLGILLATIGGIPTSSVLIFSILTLLLFGAVFVFDLA
jgi:hypothetical protein